MDYARMSAVVGDMVATMVKVRENTEILTKHIEDILFAVQEKIEEVSQQAQPAEAKPTPEKPVSLADKLDFIADHHPSFEDHPHSAQALKNDMHVRRGLMGSSKNWINEVFEDAWAEYLREYYENGRWA